MRTLAKALDALGRGDLPGVGDTLVQRFKSGELRLSGHREAARSIELLQPWVTGLTSEGEMLAANRDQLLQRKLATMKQKLAKAGQF